MSSVAVVETGELVESGEFVTLERTGLRFREDTPYEVWGTVLGKLTEAAGAVQWWVGDALQFGERKYGETYAQAIDATKFEVQTLMNWKWVAARYETSLRRENLSWSHHAVAAALDTAARDQLLGEADASNWPVSRLRSEVRAAQDAEADADGATDPGDGPPFGLILADPPWQYDQRSVRLNGTTDRHYEPMSTLAIASLPVADVAADDALLLLWTTWPFLLDAFEVIDAWGFRYITGLPWVKADEIGTGFDGDVQFKPNKGVGFWFRGATEPLLLAKRGKPSRRTMPCDGILSDRNIHSRKPTVVHDIAESFTGPYLELFARQRRSGWRTLGWGIDRCDIGEALRELAG